MSVIITNGQSWEQVAADFTLAPEYAAALPIQMNMEGQSITGKRYRLEVPDTWMKPEYAGKSITLPGVGLTPYGNAPASIVRGVPDWVLWGGLGLAVLLLVSK